MLFEVVTLSRVVMISCVVTFSRGLWGGSWPRPLASSRPLGFRGLLSRVTLSGVVTLYGVVTLSRALTLSCVVMLSRV